jgi:hypothetical protein
MSSNHGRTKTRVAAGKHTRRFPPKPPAKNTRPDGNDAAANKYRACPRPVGNRVQLLLVALYMST